jgi:3-isopropylmalate/(R)-2-methylmalate dehydratase small subunit
MILGKAHKFGDNIDTDAIIPARHLNTHDPAELAKHVMEDADPRFAAKMKVNDIIVAGENFGCGSSREHAPLALKYAGIACVVAVSFARIFFRNAINIGLPIVESREIYEKIKEGDTLMVDLEIGQAVIGGGKPIAIAPFPPFMRKIVAEGGWLPYLQKNKA